jgi:hypothetical protein
MDEAVPGEVEALYCNALTVENDETAGMDGHGPAKLCN